MYNTKIFTRIFAAALLAGTVALSGCASGGADKSAAIKDRQALMQTILKNWKPIKAFAKSGKGSSADVVKHANAINATTDQMLALFPKGSGRGDFSDKQTRTLPAVWKDWNGFKKANQTLADESAKLASIAAGGDKQAIAKQVGAMGKLGCGGCHKPFRGAKAK
ncbi:MAG: cytochrome c [Alphaproteobacteria bacterium]|nr:cytochrome c [Alphaproteobacteria bacterium]